MAMSRLGVTALTAAPRLGLTGLGPSRKKQVAMRPVVDVGMGARTVPVCQQVGHRFQASARFPAQKSRS